MGYSVRLIQALELRGSSVAPGVNLGIWDFWLCGHANSLSM
jgi:hypothetical protein